MIICLQKKIDVQIKFKKNYTSNAIDEPFEYEIKKFKLKINKNLNDNLRYFYLYNGIKIGGPMFFYIIKNEKAIKEINIYQPIKTIEKELKDNIIFISPEKIEVINNEKNTENNDENNNKNKKEKINGNSDKISNENKDEKIDEISSEIFGKMSKKINNEKMEEISNKNNDRIIYKNTDQNLINKNKNRKYMDDNYIIDPVSSTKRSGRRLTQNEKIYKKNNLTKPVSEKTFHPTKKNKICLIKKIIVILVILVLLIISGIGKALYFLLNKDKIEEIIIRKEESLMGNINYKKRVGYLYKSEEKSDVISIKENEINTTTFIEYKNYLLLILDEKEEILNDLKKIYYTGIFSQTSSYIKNKTHLMLTQSDDRVNNILQKENKNLRRAQDNNFIDYHLDNITNPFFKIEFYKNGIIRNIQVPEGFNISYMTSMKTLLNLTIPKLEEKYYVNNIEYQLNKIINQSNLEEEEEEEEEYEDEADEKLIFLNISEDDISDDEPILTSTSDNNELDANIDLMQIEKIKNEKNENISKITEFVLNNINNEFATIEGGTTNTTRKFYINEDKGSLIKIEENIIFKLDNQNKEDSEEDSINLGNFNNNNNLFQINNLIKNQTKNSNDKKYIKPDFILNTTKDVNILDPVKDDNIFKKLSNHFNSFKYLECKENNFYNQNLNLLSIKNKSSDDIIIENVNSKIRKTEEDIVKRNYYGLTKSTDTREVVSEDIIGINLKQLITSDLDPSSGLISSNVEINLGKINHKVEFPQYQTNLNIIIENINQFSYSLIKLINETNNNLNETINTTTMTGTVSGKNKKNNRLLQVINDFSHILEQPLNNIYEEITFSTTNCFSDLINIIKEIHNKYTLILNDAKTNKYEIFNEIRKITKNEYIIYIQNITYILQNFYNDTLIYIKDIKNELNSINDFQIDFLFDIIDSINESKEIFENFNYKLFDSIERGIIQFKYELDEYFNIEIGSLLYVTEFLSANINKNEILKKYIEEQKRNEVQILLKDFRNIINQIIDLLLNNINSDYEFEFSENKKESIKSINIKRINDYLFKLDSNSSELINDIKSKINFINKYELYASNIDEIERINNKTITEFCDDFYNGCMKNLLDIKPDFYDKNNKEIIKYKEQLTNISNEIKDEINNEILEINNYIVTYTKNYYNENLFKIYQNLYNFRELFLEKEMSNLVNEFEFSIIDTINNNLKRNIKFNFDLANYYLKDVERMLYKKIFKLHYYLTTGFQNQFEHFKNSFKIYLSNIQTFYNLLDKHFYKIRDDILEYINNKLNSLNKYYFDSELYKDNFYYIDQANKEISKLSNNINNYYNNLKLEGEIKIKAIKLTNTLNDYYNNLMNNFINKYTKILRKSKKRIKSRDEDFEYWNLKLPFFRWKKIGWNSGYRNYINYVKTNLVDTDKYLEKKANEIINNFKNKFNNYLSNYLSINQNLFDSLHFYAQKKINNNDNILKIFPKFENIIDEMKSKYDIQSLQKRYKSCEIESFITNLENNLNLIKDNYYNLYYKKNKSEFLEYPEEIEMKINNIYNEALKLKLIIKDNINSKYEFKISQVNKLSNTFINDLIANNKKYILNIIKFPNIFDEYKNIKFNIIRDNYNRFNVQKIEENKNLKILNQTNFDNPINNLFYYFKQFTQEIHNEINNSFYNCSIESNEINNNKTCEKFKSTIGYSEYNFNVYKLRSSIYYSINMIKNLYKLFEEYIFDDIINYDSINYLDEILNDKGFFELYNKTNIKLNQINKETYIILEPLYKKFFNGFSKKYTLENDYLPFTEYLKKILNSSDTDFLNYINDLNKYALNDLDNHLNKFNEILNLQININEHYNFSVNISYLNASLINLNKSITKSFNEKKEIILNKGNNTGVFNVLRNVLDMKIEQKIEYFKKEIDEFYKNFEINYLNYSLNLGDYISKNIKKEYYDYIFKYIYEYVELFGDSEKYFDKLYNDTLNYEKEIVTKYKNIYDYFNLTYFSKSLGEETKNYESNPDYSYETNITEKQIKEFYSIFEYNNEILNSIISNITKIIYNLNKNDYLFDYLNDIIKLDNYSITLNDMFSLFQSFDDYTAYINSNKNKEYKDLLNSSFITYYNESYTKFINNYILEDLLSNIEILINERLIFEINIFENKISDDYNYFTFLINKTEELGSTKSTFGNLYNNLKIKINETINEYLSKYLFSNFDQFIRNKNELFREKYLSFYSDNKNKNIFIFKSNEFIFEIIKEPSFNETLNKICYNIFNILKDKINLKLDQSLYIKLNNFYQLLDSKKRGIDDYLNKLRDSSEVSMDIIKNFINSYNLKISGFNSKYVFNFSNRPFLNINDFINDYLNPPLTQIKNKYNEIEKELLNQSIEKLNNLDDFSSIIENDLNLESTISKLNEDIKTFKSDVSRIVDLLFEEVDKYYCEVAYFQVIEGQEHLDRNNKIKLCNASLFFLNNETFRRLKEKDNKENFNISKYMKKIPKFNYTKNYNIKRILEENKEYNSDSPSISRKDITFFILKINETLNKFVEEVMDEQSRLMNLTLINLMNSIIYKIMPNLKFSVDNIEKKFNSILTDDNLKILSESLYYQYYKIENMTNHYIKSISQNMNSMFNTFKNSKDVFNLVTTIIYNIIMDYTNNINENILKKKQITTQYSTKRRILKVIARETEVSQNYIDKKEQVIGQIYYNITNIIQNLDIEKDELLSIIAEDFKESKNFSLIKSIGRYELKKNNNFTKLEPSSTLKNLKLIPFSLPSFNLPFSSNLMITTSFKLEKIRIYLEIGVELIYNDEDKETPIDMQIYQNFNLFFSTSIEAYAGIYLHFGLGNMHIEFGFNGVLCNSTTNTNIKINFLNNTYLREFNGILSKEYYLFLRIGMTINIIIKKFEFNYYIFNLPIFVEKENPNYIVSESFNEPFFNNSDLDKQKFYF